MFSVFYPSSKKRGKTSSLSKCLAVPVLLFWGSCKGSVFILTTALASLSQHTVGLPVASHNTALKKLCVSTELRQHSSSIKQCCTHPLTSLVHFSSQVEDVLISVISPTGDLCCAMILFHGHTKDVIQIAGNRFMLFHWWTITAFSVLVLIQYLRISTKIKTILLF